MVATPAAVTVPVVETLMVVAPPPANVTPVTGP